MWLGLLLLLPPVVPPAEPAEPPPEPIVGLPIDTPGRDLTLVSGPARLGPPLSAPTGGLAVRPPATLVGLPIETPASDLTLVAGQAPEGGAPLGQAPLGPPLTPPTGGLAVRPPATLRTTVEALGASSGVPDGVGGSWYPSSNVSRQPERRLGMNNFQVGATLPIAADENGGWYGNAAVRQLGIRTNAILPSDRVKFPGQFWDIQAGGAYLKQLESGWSWGANLNIGSASDHPFNDLTVLTVSALAFVRKPSGDKNGWLFYVVSTTNGQVGHNIPIPGAAYEYNSERMHAVLGLPFFTVDYRPTDQVQIEFVYAAITDVLLRGSYYLTERARVFVDYEWWNQAWLRADRPHLKDQTFLYEMHVEAGYGWRIPGIVEARVSVGYAFERFFVENAGLGFGGRNRVDLAPAPFVAAQIEFKY
jgi:hypothetical protein